jgi:hypothetical protein
MMMMMMMMIRFCEVERAGIGEEISLLKLKGQRNVYDFQHNNNSSSCAHFIVNNNIINAIPDPIKTSHSERLSRLSDVGLDVRTKREKNLRHLDDAFKTIN